MLRVLCMNPLLPSLESGHRQRKVKGSGLSLPLLSCVTLYELLSYSKLVFSSAKYTQYQFLLPGVVVGSKQAN